VDGWLVRTNRDGAQIGEWRARFLVGADGAASFTRRRLVGIFPARDLAVAFGYNVVEASDEGRSHDEVIVRFPKDFTGYLWAFPRPGVMNFGVASKLGERRSDELRELLSGFVRDYYGGRMPSPDRLTFFGAKIPTLELDAWSGLQTAGEDWALIGDAAGFADPITGEGIYYALKSADVLADALQEASRDSGPIMFADVGPAYERLWRDGFGRELVHASYRLPQFYHGRFFGQVITDAMVTLARFHRGVRHILVNALMGEQSYVTLKRDLLRSAYRVI
ncbi:MAG TPA: NAD(P)/FAD-dependent oxidoreductase, partial [Blastocatellia bacterium]|nr:NAD(P)/FAD-dependent oxidoreductase [Blastocatellia bacterium]